MNLKNKIFKYIEKNYYEDRLGLFIDDFNVISKICNFFGNPKIPNIINVNNNNLIIESIYKNIYDLIRNTFLIFGLIYYLYFSCTFEKIIPLLFMIFVYTTTEILHNLNRQTWHDFINLINDFDNHCKLLQPKCCLMKFKYNKSIWILLTIIFGIFMITDAIKSNLKNLEWYNNNCSVIIYVGWHFLKSISNYNYLLNLFLYYEVIIRIRLLKNNLFMRYKELSINQIDTVLVKLNIDRYQYLYRKITSIYVNLNKIIEIDYILYSTVNFCLISWLLFITDIQKTTNIYLAIFHMGVNLCTLMIWYCGASTINETVSDFYLSIDFSLNRCCRLS